MTCNFQAETGDQQDLGSFSTGFMLQVGLLCLTGVALMTGCVSSGEYEAEKARALNYQRLLAQEEQRTGELDARLQEAQQEITSLGSQNRELAAERDALQEEVRRQEERGAPDAMSGTANNIDISPDMSLSDPSLSEFELSDFSFDESDFKDLGMDKAEAADLDMGQTNVGGLGTPTYYTVVKGDTLYRISRTHGVTVEQLKQWNNLTDNIISIGQRLVVSQP